jgi:hypothetical protein
MKTSSLITKLSIVATTLADIVYAFTQRKALRNTVWIGTPDINDQGEELSREDLSLGSQAMKLSDISNGSFLQLVQMPILIAETV